MVKAQFNRSSTKLRLIPQQGQPWQDCLLSALCLDLWLQVYPKQDKRKRYTDQSSGKEAIEGHYLENLWSCTLDHMSTGRHIPADVTNEAHFPHNLLWVCK